MSHKIDGATLRDYLVPLSIVYDRGSNGNSWFLSSKLSFALGQRHHMDTRLARGTRQKGSKMVTNGEAGLIPEDASYRLSPGYTGRSKWRIQWSVWSIDKRSDRLDAAAAAAVAWSTARNAARRFCSIGNL